MNKHYIISFKCRHCGFVKESGTVSYAASDLPVKEWNCRMDCDRCGDDVHAEFTFEREYEA